MSERIDGDWPKCSQKDCDSEAMVSFVWPGKPDRQYSCYLCAMKVEDIAKAMGFPLGDVQRLEPAL